MEAKEYLKRATIEVSLAVGFTFVARVYLPAILGLIPTIEEAARNFCLYNIKKGEETKKMMKENEELLKSIFNK